MVRIEIPGREGVALEHLVLDVNGTIALDGAVPAGIAARIAAAGEALQVVAVTADTHGTAARLRDELAIEVHVLATGDEASRKRELVESLGADRVIAAGNGANDIEMVRAAAIGVCVIGDEGAAGATVAAADIVVVGAEALFGLIEHPERLKATLRT